MHVGVLIFADTEGTARALLLCEDFCFSGLSFPQGEEGFGSIGEDAIWDYPYGISEKWWDGKDKNTTVYSGMTVEELKDMVRDGRLTDEILKEMFYFYTGDADEESVVFDYFPTTEDILNAEGHKKVFVGSVHI